MDDNETARKLAARLGARMSAGVSHVRSDAELERSVDTAMRLASIAYSDYDRPDVEFDDDTVSALALNAMKLAVR